ncbi:hypothetical protein PR048_009220 [Dryococelus australis]|uniref:Uncharacterized protein n=1 Tax=Dryococelus australis TaxID=614101 RepID=A0ABQ9I077_9NEOP|nr:hypothetical protein PR048_009220 [Dryococelus australis]
MFASVVSITLIVRRNSQVTVFFGNNKRQFAVLSPLGMTSIWNFKITANSRDWLFFVKPMSTWLPNDETSNTTTINLHVLYTCSIMLVCSYNPTLSQYFEFVGADCMYKLGDKLFELIKWIACIYSIIVLMKPKPPADEVSLVAQKCCHICKELLGSDDIVVNHDHLTGKIRGSTHNKCNLNFRLPKRQLVAVFHNLQNYDDHFLIKLLAECHITLHDGTVVIDYPGKIQVIRITPEKYKCNTKQIPMGLIALERCNISISPKTTPSSNWQNRGEFFLITLLSHQTV